VKISEPEDRDKRRGLFFVCPKSFISNLSAAANCGTNTSGKIDWSTARIVGGLAGVIGMLPMMIK
jgi:hypothetical protein